MNNLLEGLFSYSKGLLKILIILFIVIIVVAALATMIFLIFWPIVCFGGFGFLVYGGYLLLYPLIVFLVKIINQFCDNLIVWANYNL